MRYVHIEHDSKKKKIPRSPAAPPPPFPHYAVSRDIRNTCPTCLSLPTDKDLTEYHTYSLI